MTPDELEAQRWRQDSITLNTVGWRMAVALGQVPEGATAVAGNPEKQLDALLAALAEAQRERDELRKIGVRLAADAAQYGRERDDQRARADRLHRDYTTLRGVRDAYERQWQDAQRREELMRPVVEKAQVYRASKLEGYVLDAAAELVAAVDTYETQTGGTDG